VGAVRFALIGKPSVVAPKDQKFFGSFFQKRTASLLYAPLRGLCASLFMRFDLGRQPLGV
jgi:hypothetical protein